VLGAIETLKAFNSRGAWVTATAYAIKDLVSNAGTWYVCVVAHTSSASLATDLATKWRVYQGIVPSDLAASSGSTMIGDDDGASGANWTTVRGFIAKIMSSAGSSLIKHISAAAGGVSRTIQSILYDLPVSLKDFGAVGDGVVYDDVAVNAWIAYLLSSGKEGHVPVGRYRMAGRWLADLHLGHKNGITFTGDGAYKSVFVVESTTSPAMSIYKSDLTVDPSVFYPTIKDVGWQFDTPNDCAAIGRSDLLDNVGNGYFENCYFGNYNTTSGSGAVLQLNYTFDCTFVNCVSVGKVGYGRPLQMRQSQFCTFIGGSYSNGDKLISFTDGVNLCGTFVGVDCENGNYIVSNEHASTDKMVFTGGYWDCWRPDTSTNGTNCITTPAGGKACIVLDNVFSSRAGMGFYAGNGLNANATANPGRVQLRGYYGAVTPSMPANGVTITNTTGQTQIVSIHGGTVSAVFVRGVTTAQAAGTFILMPGDFIAIQYSSAPTWEWAPLY